MGKGILVFVMLSTLAGTAMYATQSERKLEQATNETEYKSEVLAREAAASAFNLLVGKVKRDFEGYRTNTKDVELGKAKFDMMAEDSEDGSVSVVVVGKYGDHEYEIVGNVSKTGANVLDAVTISAPINSVTLKNDYSISGTDPGGTSSHAVRTIWAVTKDAFLSEMASSQIVGVGGDGDIVHEELNIGVAALRAKIEAYEGTNKLYLTERDWKSKDWAKGKYSKKSSSDYASGNGSSIMGNGSTPVVFHSKGDVTLQKGFVGYGVLLVEGDLTFEGNAAWNGLVFVAGSKSVFEMVDESSISGAVVIDGIDSITEVDDVKADSNDKGLLGGHFDVDVFGEEQSSRELYHQHAYDDKYDTTVLEVLNSGCKSGGLCWDQLMGPLNLTEVEIQTFNTANTAGTYSIKVGSAEHSGAMTSPISLTLDPRILSSIKFSFTSLCALVPSSPSSVQDQPDTRNGAFTLRVIDTSASGYKAGETNLGNNSGLVYEVSVYHHAKGTDKCVGAVASAETQWVNPKGDVYAGDSPECASEDDNDSYTDAWERSKKWGSRQYQKSTKNKASSKFWTPNGSCSDDTTGNKVKKVTQFVMEDDSSINYNSTILKKLKSMFSEFDMQSGSPVARRLSGTSKLRNVVVQMDGTTSPK
ncbi:hypothetical protein HQ496_00680 [bacterium]|nr:hypothetical protein [bacterium]